MPRNEAFMDELSTDCLHIVPTSPKTKQTSFLFELQLPCAVNVNAIECTEAL